MDLKYSIDCLSQCYIHGQAYWLLIFKQDSRKTILYLPATAGKGRQLRKIESALCTWNNAEIHIMLLHYQSCSFCLKKVPMFSSKSSVFNTFHSLDRLFVMLLTQLSHTLLHLFYKTWYYFRSYLIYLAFNSDLIANLKSICATEKFEHSFSLSL